MRRSFLAILGCVLSLACGGAGGGGATPPRHNRLDPGAFLLAYGASHTPTLRTPEESIETLEEQRRAARGEERRPALRALAVAHMVAAETDTNERSARRHRRDAQRLADQAATGNRDAYLAAELAFVQLFCAFRAGSRTAARAAERFTERYQSSGDLFVLAWLIRGEVALEAERWEEAATAYRYVIGLLEHPLYGFALYRTADVYRGQGRADDARTALEEVRQLACADGAAPEAEEMAVRAAAMLGTRFRDDPDGKSRPETCPPRTPAE